MLSCCMPALWIPAYAGMTVWWDCLVSPSPLIPLPSRERGTEVGVVLLYARPVDSRLRGNDGMVGLSCFTLTFDSSPIKGEGDLVVLDLLFASSCGYCLEASMTGAVLSTSTNHPVNAYPYPSMLSPP